MFKRVSPGLDATVRRQMEFQVMLHKQNNKNTNNAPPIHISFGLFVSDCLSFWIIYHWNALHMYYHAVLFCVWISFAEISINVNLTSCYNLFTLKYSVWKLVWAVLLLHVKYLIYLPSIVCQFRLISTYNKTCCCCCLLFFDSSVVEQRDNNRNAVTEPSYLLQCTK